MVDNNKTIVALLAVALVVSVAGTMYSVSELGQVSMVFRSLSGLTTSERGNVTLEVSKVISILVHNDNPVLPAGSVLEGATSCIFKTGSAATEAVSNTDNGNCLGGFANATARQNVFHLIENNGNAEANVTVKIIGVDGVSGGNSSCAFLTGIEDSNGVGGCNDGTQATLASVDVYLQIMSVSVNIPTQRAHFDNIVTQDDVNDNSTSANIIGDRNLSTSPQQIFANFKFAAYEDEVVTGFKYVIPSDALPGQRKIKLLYEASEAQA